MAEAQKVPRMGRKDYSRFVPDHVSFGAFLLSNQMRDVTNDVAKDIADVASFIAPVDEDEPGPHMADSFEVERNAGVLKVERNLRVMVKVVNHNRAAAPNEFGNSVTDRHRMLGRAGARFGDYKHGKKSGPL